MDPRSSNRQKTTTGNSKGVHRRGEVVELLRLEEAPVH